MTIVIADCGSTKSDWRIIRPDGLVDSLRGEGMNPSVDTFDGLSEKFSQLREYISPEHETRLYYYGAGVVSEAASAAIAAAFSGIFPHSQREIRSDMLGAVRGLFADGKGIAAIIGTGSNSAICDGGRILEGIPSGGYVLGDEGSGSWIGRSLLSDYIKQIMPERLRKVFYRQYGLDYAGIVEHVYSDRHPNRFLASFALFAAENRDDPYVDALIEAGFDLFFRRNILNYPFPWKLRAAGSVAYGFSDKLKTVSMRYGVDTDMIVDSPMEGLVGYHLAKLRRNV